MTDRVPGFAVNGVTVDFDAGALRDAGGAEIPLRAQSFAVLRELARNGGRVVEKDALVAAVWRGVAVTDDSLVQCVGDIRRALRDEGQAVLKTVPRRGYRLDLPPPSVSAAAAAPTRRGVALPLLTAAALAALVLVVAATAWRGPTPAQGGAPSIAVLPFDDMSAAGDHGYMGEGLAEDVISMLARSPDVLVMARNSSFAYGGAPVDVRKIGDELGVDYVLEGSVRREGDALRIVAQLNDAETGAHVWAERFEETGRDPPALLDAVSERIISSLAAERGAMKLAQFREAWGKDSASLGEYDYFLRGLDLHMNAENKAQNDRSAAIWREGLEKYPDSTLLKAKLAWYHWTAAWYWWSDDLNADFHEAGRLVEEVLAEDGLTPEVRRIAHWLYALVLMQRGAYDDAVEEAEYAISIAPYDARILRYLSEVMVAAGQYEAALDWLDTAEARDPARADSISLSRANVDRLRGRFAEAVAAFESQPDMMPYMHLSAAIAYVRLGEIDKATARVTEALKIEPGFTRTWWREGSFYSDPAILDAEVADLAVAGLPE